MSVYTSNPAGSPKVTDTTPQASKPHDFQRFEDPARKAAKPPTSGVDDKRKPQRG
jgi:hypothetical protein